MTAGARRGTVRLILTGAAVVLCALLLVTFLATASLAGTRWTQNGVAVATGNGDQDVIAVVTDGAGGAIVVWQDDEGGIYARRVTSAGTLAWYSEVSGAWQSDLDVSADPDGLGGVVLGWCDDRDGGGGDTYAQRIDSTGLRLWGENGVTVCDDSFPQRNAAVLGVGGQAILAWTDMRSGMNDIYAGKVLADGTPTWTADGVALCEASANQDEPVITTDGAGGAIVAWEDERNYDYDIYAQRVDSGGTPRWMNDGTDITIAEYDQTSPRIITDGAGGAIISWQSWHPVTHMDIYARKVNQFGVPQWLPGGIPLCTESHYQECPEIATDDAGGAIVTWEDSRASYRDIYAARISTAGAPLWTADGVGVCTYPNSPECEPRIVADGSGGAVIAWTDYRVFYGPEDDEMDIFAQRVDSGGNAQWTPQGAAVCIHEKNQYRPMLVADGTGEAIVAWDDHRAELYDTDVYAQRAMDDPPPTVTSITPSSGHNTGTIAITDLAGQDFRLDPVVKLQMPEQSDINATDVRAVSSTKITCNFDLSGAVAGSWDVYVENDDGQNHTLPGAFEVLEYPPPNATGIAPDTGERGQVLNDVSITGSDFRDVATTVELRRGADTITGTDVQFVSAAQITADFSIPAGASVGSDWDLYVEHEDDGRNDTLDNAFTVQYPAPTVTSVAPDSAPNNGVVQITDLKGTGFRNGASAYLTGPMGSGTAGAGTITAGHVSVVTSTKLTCSFDLEGAATGSYDLKVRNSDGKSATLTDAFTVTSSEPGSNAWYLPEGSTRWGFTTYVAISNPNPDPVDVEVTYMTEAGPVQGPPVHIEGLSRTTLYPETTVGSCDFSTRITSDAPVVADRTMMWTGPGAPGPEYHASVGVTSPAKTWYMPEGSSRWGFETWLLIQNPNESTVTCTVTYMIQGEGPAVRYHAVDANSRASFSMENDIGQKDASIKVECEKPVIPERAMYRNNRREGHDSIGTTGPSPTFYLAEGTTGWGFTTYVLVQNPQNTAADVTLTYMTGSGPVSMPSFSMPPQSRHTVRVNDQLPGTDLSTRVEANVPIIAERAMYWDNGTGEACHDSVGTAGPSKAFCFGDGASTLDAETWTCVQNLSDDEVEIRISYLGGFVEPGPVTFTDTMPANSRKTYNMADKLNPEGMYTAGVKVECLTPGAEIMAERAMYFNGRGAGTVTIGGYAE
ncbi:MAG: hypothetical protein KKE36_11830 [Actinobacteria bacterium]|nr:hypothetical protein [Actinomycetota bacterium]